MSRQVLITGGAGFIGSHVADELLARGYRVRAFDNLARQVHGPMGARPPYLDPAVEFVPGDIRDPEAVRRALIGVDAVFHFAACVGVGQSRYELARYTDVNNLGTAILLQALIERPVERLVVASSMSLYGEGLYRSRDGTLVDGCERTVEQLKAKRWDLCNDQGEPLAPLPTPETKAPTLASVYALSKYDRVHVRDGRAGLRDPDGRIALFQCIRHAPSPLEPIHRRPPYLPRAISTTSRR